MHCAVYNASCVSPLDDEMLQTIKAPLITVEESIITGGMGSLVSLYCARKGLAAPVLMLGLEGICATQGNHEKQLEAHGLNAASIVVRVMAWRNKR